MGVTGSGLCKFNKQAWICKIRTDAKVEISIICAGRKCDWKNFITFRNYMKLRYLAFENFGRKC